MNEFMGIKINQEEISEAKALYDVRKSAARKALNELYAKAVFELDLPEENLVGPSMDEKLEVIKRYLA